MKENGKKMDEDEGRWWMRTKEVGKKWMRTKKDGQKWDEDEDRWQEMDEDEGERVSTGYNTCVVHDWIQV